MTNLDDSLIKYENKRREQLNQKCLHGMSTEDLKLGVLNNETTILELIADMGNMNFKSVDDTKQYVVQRLAFSGEDTIDIENPLVWTFLAMNNMPVSKLD
ncbi:hypothetical protein MOO46_07400 (plasmid) [Apilactobacillus apisilvae]|uniref:Uncharacterized protein n=1 Tax=Apilactobacillus apisilvae TaxID=2923364 RepID=A0ABY4PJJ2_9LACO|nr:hypothetical protein [Apilactobacillus apisilvae]UQS85810.1 hypothetical protein MOO46_07400 [Apilactobacillus apisilvae]